MSATRMPRASTKWMRLAASAALLAGALTAAHAQCKYKRLGAIPSEWVGSRLMIDGSVNDKPLRMAIDTGAYWTTMSGALAQRLDVGLAHVDNFNVGFGGKSEISMGMLQELSIGRFQWRNAKVSVVWQEADLPDVLVGANLLLNKDVEFDGTQIVFFEPSGCGDTSLAYWADDVPWVPTEGVTERDWRTNVTVQVNGQPVRALVDSGAPVTILDRGAARRLGVDPDDPAAQVGEAGGIGAHATTRSTATFDTIAIGPEIVRHARIEVADLWKGVREDIHTMATERFVSEQPEMVLGADFVRSHRLLFATSQRRLYFSYLGGEVFRAPKPRPAVAAAKPSVAD